MPRTRTFIALMLGAGLLLAYGLLSAGAAATPAPAGGPAFTPSAYAYLPALSYAPPPTPTATPVPAARWLARLNAQRGLADLPAATENAAWSNGDWLHARYMAKNGQVTHSEDPANRWYTAEGSAAGQNGNVAGTWDPNAGDDDLIDMWMQGPFHALGILDPRLAQVGFGVYREAAAPLPVGAALDVLRGLDWGKQVAYPVMWPANGKTVAITRFDGGESPDPLSGCVGYTTPTGLPILLQPGSGGAAAAVTAHSFRYGGTELAHCVFDETNYVNRDANSQNLGRSVLKMRNAVVLIPKAPLQPGCTYTASITSSGHAYTWSFAVSPDAGGSDSNKWQVGAVAPRQGGR